jgi:hypothetical protein
LASYAIAGMSTCHAFFCSLISEKVCEVTAVLYLEEN